MADEEFIEKCRQYLLAIDSKSFNCERWLAERNGIHELHDVEKIMKDTMLTIKTMPPISGLRFKDWDGSEIECWEWSFKKNYLNSHVGYEIIGDFAVSTVWTGDVRIRYYGDASDIFETMIFKEGHPLHNWLERYSCYEKALEGHSNVCNTLRQGREKELMMLSDISFE